MSVPMRPWAIPLVMRFKGDFREGCYGAGTGATVGKLCGPDYMMKSGVGAYAVSVGDLKVCAIVVVNAVGDVLGESGEILSGMRSRDGKGFADTRRVMLEEAGITPTLFSQRAVGTTTNTTIGAVVTNGRFDKAQLKKNSRPRQQRHGPHDSTGQYDGRRRFPVCSQHRHRFSRNQFDRNPGSLRRRTGGPPCRFAG